MTRFWRRPRSFGAKLTLLVTVSNGIAVIAVCSLLAATDYADLRRETLESLQSQADMVSFNSSAPLAFQDAKRGAEALAALRASPRVASATLTDDRGKVFASYRRDDNPAPAFAATANGRRQHGRWLVLSMPVVDRGEEQGRLQLVCDLNYIYRRLWSSILLALAVAAGAMLLSYLVARRLQQALVAPIDELVGTAAKVSSSRDYGHRAAKLSDDELGRLTDAFNEMLTEIQAQQRELRSSHAEREASLASERAARAEAERASRMKDDFVATLSHELRTPLTPILGWVQLLRRAGPRDGQTLQGLEVIERNVRVQTQIIDDLLDMSRIVSGKIRLDVQRVDLAELIDAAIITVRPAADAREVRIQTLFDPNAGPLRGDPNRLQQIIWNLLTNAIKFTGRGGRVQVSLARVNSHVEITVADSGQGISAEFLPHVFERFRQADSSTTRAHGGLGLGLAIVKQLVELHGGSVRAASAGIGEGATFTVELPVMAASIEGDGGSREHPRASRGLPMDDTRPSFARRTVLVVDDDADARELVSQILEQYEATVVRAGSAAEALQALQSARPDVLVSDIGMPGMDGYELVRHVRALPATSGGATPAIALTAFARTEDRTRALLAGYQLHIAKPIEPAELVAAVASLLSRSMGADGGAFGK